MFQFEVKSTEAKDITFKRGPLHIMVMEPGGDTAVAVVRKHPHFVSLIAIRWYLVGKTLKSSRYNQ